MIVDVEEKQLMISLKKQHTLTFFCKKVLSGILDGGM